jgi:hypothetical protein
VAAFSRAVSGPRGVEEPEHARDLFMLRTGRSHGHPPWCWLGGSCGEGQGRNPVMDDREKSDGRVVPEKLPNNAQGGAAEAVEGRRPAKGNTTSETRPGRSAGQGALSELGRVRRVAATDKEARFTALLHHVDVDRLRAAYWALNPKAATGVDGVRWADYWALQLLRGARQHRGAQRLPQRDHRALAQIASASQSAQQVDLEADGAPR